MSATVILIQFEAIPVWETWRIALPILLTYYPRMEFRGEKGPLDLGSVAKLKKAKVDSFRVELWEAGKSDYGVLVTIDEKMMEVKSDTQIPLAGYRGWTFGEFAKKMTIAHVAANDYESYQSTSHVGTLRMLGRLPADKAATDQQYFDVSRNPGLLIARGHPFDPNYHCEAVGALMWLGPKFEKVCGRPNLDALTSSAWCQISQTEPGITRIVSADDLFDSDQGEQAERQRALRDALFPHRRPVDKDGFDVEPG